MLTGVSDAALFEMRNKTFRLEFCFFMSFHIFENEGLLEGEISLTVFHDNDVPSTILNGRGSLQLELETNLNPHASMYSNTTVPSHLSATARAYH